MNLSRKRLVLIAVLLLVIAFASGNYYYRSEEAEKALAAQIAAIQQQKDNRADQLEAQLKQKMLAEARPKKDLPMSVYVPQLYPRPPSEWKSTEKLIYQKLLSNGQFDVLIVPFQVQDFALDRPSRSLMTAELALAVSMEQKSRVPDPYLVARALGDGDRRLDPNDVYSLADKIGAKKIIWGYVGHDKKNKMILSIQLQERGANGALHAQTALVTKNFENIDFSDVQPPIEVYQSLMPEILTAIGVDGKAFLSLKPESRIDSAELPISPLAMAEKMREPARDALYFQVLASLSPEISGRAKERFVEKSLLAILGMSPNSPDYRVLKARAFMLLGLRPAALQILHSPKTIEEKELFAALNGNQPDVEQLSSQIKPVAKRLLSKLDANYLASVYEGADKNKSIAIAASLQLPGKIWPYFAARRFSASDFWAQFDNVNLKNLLDYEFPIKDYTLDGIIRGVATLGDVENLETLRDLSVVNHVRKLLEIDAKKWCCQFAIDRPSALDYLTLIEAIGDDNLMRRADFLATVQGAPERALQMLSRIESVYKGHPYFSMVLAKAQIGRAKATDGAAKEGQLKSAYANLFNAMYWEQGQSAISADCHDILVEMRRDDYGLWEGLYPSDYPFRPYYPLADHGGQTAGIIANAEAAINNSTANLMAFEYLNRFYTENKQDDKRAELFKSVEGRFVGNPEMYQMLADNSVISGNLPLAEGYYREAIKVQPRIWGVYRDLGTLFVEEGQLEKASKLFLSHPALKKGSKMNPVEIASAAFDAGSMFFWLGELPLARPLYEIASRTQTGSGSEMSSRSRLRLIEQDFPAALSGTLEVANRYNDPTAYRDYLGMLHAMGGQKDAWEAFYLLANKFDNTPIWETALVGHRKEGKTEADIGEWVKQEIGRNIGKNSNRAARYLLLAGVTDRIPSKAFAMNVAEVAQPVWQMNQKNGYVIQSSDDGSINNVQGPLFSEDRPRPTGYAGTPEKIRVKSSLVYFAEAYRSIRLGDNKLAQASLQEASTLYDLSENDVAYLLPYYAFAAAKVGDVSAIEKYMENFSFKRRRFDYFLAKAIISGLAGKTTESVTFLKSAFYKRPSTGMRPLFAEYQYAEICEWLFEATAKPAYKEIALDWAKKNQKLQPWFSWAYAMEAVLSNSKVERMRAISMAFYLDPQSELLGRIPKEEREIAIREYRTKNPFLKKDNAANSAPI